MKKLLLILFLILSLAACEPDPRDAAQAEAIRLNAQQNSADRIQARQEAADQAALNLQQEQAISAAKVQAENITIYYAGILGTIALGLLFLALAAGLSWAMIGTGRAWVRAAEVKANLITLNPETRQFPLFIQYTGKGQFTLTNPNTGSVAFLDTRRAADRQMITASAAVQLAGAIATEARRSKDPAAVAIIQPPLITGDPHHE